MFTQRDTFAVYQPDLMREKSDFVLKFISFRIFFTPFVRKQFQRIGGVRRNANETMNLKIKAAGLLSISFHFRSPYRD